MIITGKKLSRRTVLKGLGTVIALPALDAMAPAFAGPAASKAPLRLAFAYVPNGIIMNEWTPDRTGKGFDFKRTLKPLEPFQDDLLVLTGLDQYQGNDLGDGPGDHARAAAAYLTGVHPKKTAGADIHNGISVDQIAAAAFEAKTRFPSVEMGCDDSRTVGNCDSGYSCAYTNNISWRGPSTPMPPETNPRALFERLFGTEELSADPRVRARRIAYRKSILDMVGDRTKSLMGQLGSGDRRKLDEYLYAVREIEQRIEKAERNSRSVNPSMEKPAGVPITFSEHLKLMFDLQLVAFQTDSTRVSTLVIGREGSTRTYGEIGVPDPHHPLSHHRNNPDWIEKLTKIDGFHVSLFAYYLGKLKSTPDGDGSMLDHSIVIFGGGLSDGNRHIHENLPTVLAGKGCGTVNTGRHVVFPKGTPMTNLFLAILDRMGVRTDKLGDSNGELNHLSDI